MSQTPRQGRIAGWLKMNQSSVRKLAVHCGLSDGTMSRHCNAEEVPTLVRSQMEAFTTPTGKHIPTEYLPMGVDKKPGPAKGWLDKRLAEAATSNAA